MESLELHSRRLKYPGRGHKSRKCFRGNNYWVSKLNRLDACPARETQRDEPGPPAELRLPERSYDDSLPRRGTDVLLGE